MRCEMLASSECVMPGHPDKLADLISDSVLDAYLKVDPLARVAVETLVTSEKVILAGEVSAKSHPEDLVAVVREVIRDVGYINSAFNYNDVTVELLLKPQSAELDRALGDNNAGDQSIVFGYATSENESYMPTAAYYACMILQDIYYDVRSKNLPRLGPDGKMMVNITYKDGLPVGINSVVLLLQHEEGACNLDELMFEYTKSRLPDGWLTRDKFLFNTSGSFVIGGPMADTGLTGRKLMVDGCGAGAPSGGGAFSGKDASKIDRSGAYMARYLAKSIVISGLADKCAVKLVYCIGVADPLIISLDTFGTARVPEDRLISIIKNNIDLTPSGIFSRFDLGRPIYKQTSLFSHFGRPGLPWEEVDLMDCFLHVPVM